MTAAKSLAPREVAHVIEIRRNRPVVSSLKIAELFGRPHKSVLRVLRDLSGIPASEETTENLAAQKGGVLKRGRGRNIEIAASVLTGKVNWETYTDERGKEQPIAWLSEREALIAMPFFGGRKAHEGQRQLVDAYLYYRDNFANPPRRDLLTAKRAANRPMLDALVEAREEAGKATEAHHYMTEARLCNKVLTGKYAKLDEKTLSNDDVELLEKIRDRNRAFILAGMSYADRKAKLQQYALRQRTRQIADGRGRHQVEHLKMAG